MAEHLLKSNPETVHWGYFDASLKPVLTIASGDRVTVEMSPYDLEKGRLIFRHKDERPSGSGAPRGAAQRGGQFRRR